MARFIFSVLDRLCILLGALLFVQAPLFMQQYQHQLVGHIAELQFQVDKMQQAAAVSGKTLGQFTQKFVMSGDADFSAQGKLMHGMVQRLEYFSQALAALTHATPLTRPLLFIQHLNYQIAKSTFTHFQLGMVFTWEGLMYGVLGMAFGYFCFLLLRKAFFYSKLAFAQKK